MARERTLFLPDPCSFSVVIYMCKFHIACQSNSTFIFVAWQDPRRNVRCCMVWKLTAKKCCSHFVVIKRNYDNSRLKAEKLNGSLKACVVFSVHGNKSVGAFLLSGNFKIKGVSLQKSVEE